METTQTTLGAAIVANAIVLVFYAVPSIIIFWKLYTKAGQAGWKAIIPFYSQYIMGVIAKRPTFGLIAAVAGAVNYVVGFLKFDILTILTALVFVVFGLITLSKFIQKYDAGIGKWALYLFLPIIGVFFVEKTEFKGDGSNPAQPPTQPTDPSQTTVSTAVTANTPDAVTTQPVSNPTPQPTPTPAAPTIPPVATSPQPTPQPQPQTPPAPDNQNNTPPAPTNPAQ